MSPVERCCPFVDRIDGDSHRSNLTGCVKRDPQRSSKEITAELSILIVAIDRKPPKQYCGQFRIARILVSNQCRQIVSVDD